MPRDGESYLKSLRDGREIIHMGRRVEDVTTDAAYRNSVASFARLYDFQCRPENVERMTFVSPSSGERVNRCWQLPASYQEMVERRQAIQAWAELHYGFMGRSPDHVSSTLTGMYQGLNFFEEYDKKRASAFREYFHYIRDKDLFLTYVIINPPEDRGKNPGERQSNNVRVVDEDAEGITVEGCKMLGTSSIMADEVLVSCLQPLKPGDEDYALTFCVPMNHKGLKVLSRKSYEWTAHSVFDNPLASRFDENDAVIYFSESKIPWERVFVYRDVAMARNQFHAAPAHIQQNYQAQMRLEVKMRFLVGLAHRITEAIGTTKMPAVTDLLGFLAAQAGSVKAFVAAIEAAGERHGPYFIPNRHLVYTAQVLTQAMYPQVINTLRELSGGNLIMLPSGIEDLADATLKKWSLQAQISPAMTPEEKVKLFKLAWDAVGSEFASRHTQYEMFYAGAPFTTRGNSYRTYDWQAASDMVDSMLASYDLDEEIKRLKAAKAAE